MNKHFSYSILQYKHSLTLGEVLNVGVLFHFPSSEHTRDHIEFVFGNGYRAKSIYPHFDTSLFNSFLKTINKKIVDANNLYQAEALNEGFREFIHKYILAEDASALQFTEPFSVVNSFKNNGQAVKSFSEFLLPGIVTEHPKITKHNEAFIVRKYLGYIFENHNKEDVQDKLIKNKIITNENGVNLKFEIAWQNGSLNLVKPVSFDLNNTLSIQNKAAEIKGYLEWFTETAKKDNLNFDFLIAKPQNRSLYKIYDTCLKSIDETKAPKRLFVDNEWEEYSEYTFEQLSKD